MPYVMAQLHITPIGTETPSISTYIAAAETILKQYPDIKSELHPMSTTLEGELSSILRAVQAMHEAPFAKGALRVSTTLRIDDRRDGNAHSMTEKVASVHAKMQ